SVDNNLQTRKTTSNEVFGASKASPRKYKELLPLYKDLDGDQIEDGLHILACPHPVCCVAGQVCTLSY
ncbi:hypothetical protein ACQP3F_31630, partial [Escherichia coli]